MMRKMLLAAALSVTAMTAHADYQCSVTPRDDVIVSPQIVQVKGENGNLVITPDGNVMYNGKQYSLNAAQREQADLPSVKHCFSPCRERRSGSLPRARRLSTPHKQVHCPSARR